MAKLALFGGDPVRQTPFPRHPVITDDEKRAVMDVLERGELSSFLAVAGQYFLGGKQIKEFERRVAEFHGSAFAVAFNSATAALHAAVVACGVQPGEEVIVPPYTFTATASCALMANAVPVFADVDPRTACITAETIRQNITPRSRAVIPVHLFGHPADMDSIMEVAREHDLKVIEDCAQAPGALYHGKYVGTIGHCGIFSFTENKNITTGEGGMLITNDPAIAEVARMVRNHGEAIWEGQTTRTYTATMLGWNYRMTEMEAALGIVQFGKLQQLNDVRIELSEYLTEKLRGVPGLTVPIVQSGCTHVYYIYALGYDQAVSGIHRNDFVKALVAEGIPTGAGYIRPLYLSPIYQERKLLPFRIHEGPLNYAEGSCPVAERLHRSDLLLTLVARPPATRRDMDDIVRAVEKVLSNAAAFSQAVAGV